jgi:hypothetical protein
VAFNQGILRALQEELKTDIIIPPHHEVMGAIGAALLAREAAKKTKDTCRFRGFDISEVAYDTSSFECHSCPTSCEIVNISQQGNVVAAWGGQCDIWETVAHGKREKIDKH